MGITYVSGYETGSVSASPLVINKPSVGQDGDVFIAHITSDGDNVISPPAGWVEIYAGDNAVAVHNAVYYKVISDFSGEPSSYSFTYTENEKVIGVITVWRGVDNTTPIDVQNTNQNTGIGSSPVGLAETTGTDNTMVICPFGSDRQAATIIQPSGMAKRYAYEEGTTQGCVQGLASVLQATAGTTGNKGWSTGVNEEWICGLFALKEAFAGETHTPSDDANAIDSTKFAAESKLTDDVNATDSITLAAESKLADDANASDEVTTKVEESFSDDANASDSIQINAASKLSDNPKANDGIATKVEKPLGDNAKTSDSISFKVTIALTDDANASDGISFDYGFETHTPNDTAKANDSIKFKVKSELTDDANASDSIKSSVEFPLDDDANASDGISFDYGIEIHTPSDIAKANDSIKFSAKSSLADLAKSLDALELAASKEIADDANASDALSLKVEKSISDSAKASDSLIVTVKKYIIDTAKSSDIISFLKHAKLSLGDTAKASDVISFLKHAKLALGDIAKASDRVRFFTGKVKYALQSNETKLKGRQSNEPKLKVRQSNETKLKSKQSNE